MIGPNVLRDLDIDSLVTALPTYTEAGRDALRARLSAPVDDPNELEMRQAEIRSIKARVASSNKQINGLRKQLRDAEADVVSVATASEDKRHAEYYAQILWDPKSRFAWLNKIGWLSEAIIMFRTLLLPGLAIILPIFVFVAPLVFYNLFLNEPLTLHGYFDLIQTSIKKAMPSVLGKPRFAGSGGILELGEKFVHVGVSIAMFVASIWNQVSAAINMRSVVADIRRRADSVAVFAKATVELGAALGVSTPPTGQTGDQLGLFGEAWNAPAQIHALMETAGRLDMLAAIALTKRTCFPEYGSAALKVVDLFHPGLQPKARIYNSLTMGDKDSQRHVLLTGPNRGGKSTLLKSLGTAVLMSQTLGVVFARSATLPIFSHIITALAPQDVIGKLSLFEAEIEFAKEVKALVDTKDSGPVFLMMDEIFHGTNAHDGVEASQVFLDDLYATKAAVFSVVSTHYMDLPKRYGSSSSSEGRTQNLCMDASVDPNDPDRLIYTYMLKKGVNEYSSVREILRERGLICSKAPCVSAPKKTTEDGSKA